LNNTREAAVAVSMVCRQLHQSSSSSSSSRHVTQDYHEFTRYGDAVTTTTSNVTEPLTYSFALTDVLNYTEFTTMFDQYKIKMVEFKIQMITNPDAPIMTNNSPASTNNSNNWYPKFWYIRDYDGNTSADTLAEIKERVGVKFFVMKPNREYTIKIKPKVLVQTYKTLTTTGYAPKVLWIDFATNNVPHYGLNAVIDCLGLNPADIYSNRAVLALTARTRTPTPHP
jgi:hypothetical protein